MSTYDDDNYQYKDDDYVEDEGGVEAEPQDDAKPGRPERVVQLPGIEHVVTPDTQYATVKFTRSFVTGPSRNDMAHMGIEYPVPLPPGLSLRDGIVRCQDAITAVKGLIYDEAGIAANVDEGGVLREVIRQQLPGTTEQQQSAPSQRPQGGGQRGGGGQQSGGSRGDYPHPADMEKPQHVDPTLWNELLNTYPQDWYDNRGEKASGRYRSDSPDFKQKDRGDGIWLVQKGRGSYDRNRRAS